MTVQQVARTPNPYSRCGVGHGLDPWIVPQGNGYGAPVHGPGWLGVGLGITGSGTSAGHLARPPLS